MSSRKIITVDGFYSDPDAVRNMALKLDYRSGAKYNYPGYQATRSAGTGKLGVAFEKLVGKPLAIDPQRFTFGGFRIVTDQTGMMPKVHADSAVDWAAIIYLTPNAQLRGGTGFYKHKETGLEGPPSDRLARKMGFEDAIEFENQIVRRDMADLDAWDLVSYTAPVYNRLILFRGNQLYHAPLGGFGNTIQDGRLIHIFFFNEK